MTISEPMELKQRINFKSSRDNITIVEKIIDDVCSTNVVNEDHYGNLLIALTEAVNNAIVHGNKNDESKNVFLEYCSADGVLEFKIEDEGPGFDYENLPDPTDPVNIEKPNGRGVFLMRNLADEVNFTENGRIVEMKFNLAN